MYEENPIEYPPQEEPGPGDPGTGTGTGTGTGSNPTGGSGTGTGTGSGSPFLGIGSGGSGSGSIFDAAKKLLSTITGLKMTDTKTEKVEKKKEEETTDNVPAPIAANNAVKVQPWVWYVGGAVVGLAIIGGFIWYKKRR